MAITLSTASEPLLSRKNITLIRSVLAVSQLNEAINALDKIETTFSSYNTLGSVGATKIKSVKEHLSSEIAKILMTIPIPNVSARIPSSGEVANTTP